MAVTTLHAPIDDLVELLGKSGVLVGDAVNDDVTHDECLTSTPQRPLAVVRPRNEEQVAAVVRWAAEHHVPLTARGSGTGLAGACIPRPAPATDRPGVHRPALHGLDRVQRRPRAGHQ